MIIDWPLSGYAPVLGNYGVGLAMLITSSLFILLVMKKLRGYIVFTGVIAIWLLGVLLNTIQWTSPVDKEIDVAIIINDVIIKSPLKDDTIIPIASYIIISNVIVI